MNLKPHIRRRQRWVQQVFGHLSELWCGWNYMYPRFMVFFVAAAFSGAFLLLFEGNVSLGKNLKDEQLLSIPEPALPRNSLWFDKHFVPSNEFWRYSCRTTTGEKKGILPVEKVYALKFSAGELSVWRLPVDTRCLPKVVVQEIPAKASQEEVHDETTYSGVAHHRKYRNTIRARETT